MKYARLGQRSEINNIIDLDVTKHFSKEGLVELTDEQCAAAQSMRLNKQTPLLIDCEVVSVASEMEKGVLLRWDNELKQYKKTIQKKPVRSISKLSIRRELRAMGAEEAFESMLDMIPNARRDWDDAQDIRTDDPMFVDNMEAVKSMIGITDEQFEKLLEL